MSIQEIKDYLRVDGDTENNLIQGLQLAAEQYLNNTGVNKDYTNELYKLAVMLLVSHWYENRDVEKIGVSVNKLRFSLDSIITQLKYCQESETM